LDTIDRCNETSKFNVLFHSCVCHSMGNTQFSQEEARIYKPISKREVVWELVPHWFINMLAFNLLNAFGIFFHDEVVNHLFFFFLYCGLLYLFLGALITKEPSTFVWTVSKVVIILLSFLMTIIITISSHIQELCNLEPSSFTTFQVQVVVHIWNFRNDIDLWCRDWKWNKNHHLLWIILVGLEVDNMRIFHIVKVHPFLELEAPFNMWRFHRQLNTPPIHLLV